MRALPGLLRDLHLFLGKPLLLPEFIYLKMSILVSQLNRLLKIGIWIPAFALLFAYHWIFSFDHLLASHIMLTATDVAGLYASSVFINRYLIPQLLYKRRLIIFTLLLIITFICSSLLIQLVQSLWFNFAKSLDEQSRMVLNSLTYQLFNTYIIQFLGSACICVFRLSNDHRLSQMRYETLQKEKAQTELNFLKAQINPHFLFNSLNSLYAEIDKSNMEARNILLKFSEMLRYQLYECNVDEIAIEKEIEYLRNYVELERRRKEDLLEVNFEINGKMSGFTIAPLIFITFIENAFKYASNHEDKANILRVRLEKEGGFIMFECNNTKDKILSRDLVEDHGIGINNVKRRLELLYPERHDMTIVNEENMFSVKLKINLE